MNIFISANDKYIYSAQVMLTSFFLHNHDEKHHIYFMYRAVTEENIRKLECIVLKNSAQFIPVKITETEFDGFGNSERFPVEVYYRLLIPEILDKEERALWLDVDLVINGSLNEFYHQDFENCSFSACESIGDHSHIIKSLGHLSNTKYINSGVLLINIDVMKKFTTQDYREYYQKYENVITWFDQDVLNGMFAGTIKVFDNKKYNVQILNGRFPDRKQVQLIAEAAVIVHYIGHYKPWHKEYTNPCAEIWDYYHAITFGKGKGYIIKQRFNRWMRRRVFDPFKNLRSHIYDHVYIIKRIRDWLRK